ncbi:MAG: radical SAM protein, partial [Desulfobulbaceae bacterium]|nr:radical SAM protein [Desulfobulbaceae bacterium]
MHYEGTIIRPPSEAFSIILQVTAGCSHNRCTFCGAYRDKPFSFKDDKQVAKDIDFAAAYCKRQKTLFLADGNCLVLSQKKLCAILKKIRKRLPWVRRVSLYGNCRDILAKSDKELTQLRELGLGRIYMGLESGHDETLYRIDKGSNSEEMINGAHKAKKAGIFLSVTSLLG